MNDILMVLKNHGFITFFEQGRRNNDEIEKYYLHSIMWKTMLGKQNKQRSTNAKLDCHFKSQLLDQGSSVHLKNRSSLFEQEEKIFY